MKYAFFVVAILWITPASSSALDKWYEDQKSKSLELLLSNISRSDTPVGFVVASPSKNDPNYYYHWVRDAALVMRALDETLNNGPQKFNLFHDYIALASHHQQVYAHTGLGEPKFNIDGSSFKGPWGRPQNDGAALRAITLSWYALSLLENGKAEYVRKYLYRSTLPAMGVIKKDLEYISHHWNEPDYDLWEEVKGQHFYTRMAQRTAMALGARLSTALGDHGASSWYTLQGSGINAELEDHYSEKDRFIHSTLNRVAGLDYKNSNLDTSVILAVNHSWMPGLSFGPHDPRVRKTAKKLTESFKSTYPINRSKSLGVAMGRYPEDRYFGGNPWFLLTNAMAEYYEDLGNSELRDRFLKRVKAHTSAAGRMDEQFDRSTGRMVGARDLTWSYASFLTVKK